MYQLQTVLMIACVSFYIGYQICKGIYDTKYGKTDENNKLNMDIINNQHETIKRYEQLLIDNNIIKPTLIPKRCMPRR